MSDLTEIQAGHPLFRELRNGLLWHCTSVGEFREIRASGSIVPNDGRVNKWDKPYACQELGGISLFDLTTEEETEVLREANKWQQFFGCARPVTVVLGLDRSRLSGRLVPYPQNKEGTTGNVIPCVEVCHCGPIGMSSIVSHLLVCAIDYSRFRKHEDLSEEALTHAEREFGEVVRREGERRAQQAAKLHALAESPAFKKRLEQARRRIDETMKQM
jgi:hypothetical protein